MKSTLIELPPEAISLEEESFVEAASVEELAEKTDVEDEVLGRVFLPGREIGPYRIVGYVASGGMGDIYAAKRMMDDGRLLGPVALKVIAPELRGEWQIEERFKREAAISKAIRSPNVARVYEFGESEDGYLFLSMELLRGEELFDRIVTLRRLEPTAVVRIILEALAGLHAVHESGFIHRDLKPENIYLSRQTDEETVKILDFGIAKRSDEPSDPFLSVVGKIYGTPEYIAPEQGLNPDVDRRADLYSIGVIMHEALSGVLPFQGDTAYATILKHQNDEPPPLPDGVDDDLEKIIFKAMAKKPKDRYQTAAEMAADLRDWYVRRHDDELSQELRDSREMDKPKIRRKTPGRQADTPIEGTPVPNLMPTRKSRRKPKKKPSKKAASSKKPAPPPDHAAPPPATASADELPVVGASESSPVAGIVTAVAVLLIIAAVVWTFVM
jgi:serine/threonine-protein kinase